MQLNLTTSNIAKQDIIMMPISDYSDNSDIYQFTLDKKYVPPKPPKPKKSLWWIYVLGAGVLVIVGVVAFFIIRKRKLMQNNET